MWVVLLASCRTAALPLGVLIGTCLRGAFCVASVGPFCGAVYVQGEGLEPSVRALRGSYLLLPKISRAITIFMISVDPSICLHIRR